jgi:hypothetical protein
MSRTNWKQRALNAERALSEIRAVFEVFDLADDVAAKARTSNKPKRHPDTKSAIDWFHKAYLKAYAVKPTWDGKTTKMLDDLVRKHGVAEVTLRIDNLFEGLLDWLSPPYTVSALRQHFDKLIRLDAANPLDEWSKVANIVRLFGRDFHRVQASVAYAKLNPRTRSIIERWGWANICNTKEDFAASQFTRHWHQGA